METLKLRVDSFFPSILNSIRNTNRDKIVKRLIYRVYINVYTRCLCLNRKMTISIIGFIILCNWASYIPLLYFAFTSTCYLLCCLCCKYIKKIRTISDDFQPPTVMLYAFSPEYHTVRWDRISLHYVLVCWLDCNIHLKFDEKVKPLAVWIA